MSNPLTILGIAGSLLQKSYNRAALRAAQKLAPERSSVEVFDLDGIPPFNQDNESPLPSRVAQLKARIQAADAFLLSRPNTTTRSPEC
jgi:chromate reductase